MKLPQDSSKYNAKFKYVEVGRYVELVDGARLVRHQKGPKGERTPVLLDKEEVERYADNNNRLGIYTSVFQYESRDLFNSTSLGSLCFDFDSDNLELARTETLRLVSYLLTYIPESAVSVFFSGQKGFHIECEAIALNISTTDDMAGVFKFIAENLSKELELGTMDQVVYDSRRMWRLANTRHQRSGLFKVECMRLLQLPVATILNHAEKMQPFEIPEQEFNLKANKWYKDFVGLYEKSKFETFLRDGANTDGYEMSDDKIDRMLFEAVSGTRNHTLNKAVYIYVSKDPEMSLSTVENHFMERALKKGLNKGEISATIKSAYRAAKINASNKG